MILRLNGKLSLFLFMLFAGTTIYYATTDRFFCFLIILAGVIYSFFMAYSKEDLAIWFMLIMAHDCWGLVPMIRIGAGVLHWSDFTILYAVLLWIKHIKLIRAYRFGYAYSCMIGFIGIALVQSWRLYGQSPIVTICTARGLWVVIAFWPLVALVKNAVVTKRQLLQLILKFTKITIAVYWAEMLLVNLGFSITFYQTNERLGARIYIDPVFVFLLFFYYLYLLLYKQRRIGGKNLAGCLVCFLTIALVSQSRSATVYMIVTACIMTILSKKSRKIFLYGMLAVTIAVTSILAIPSLRKEIAVMYDGFRNNGDSLAVREIEKEYYNVLLQGHQLFGVGIPNNHLGKAVIYSGQFQDLEIQKYNNYFLSDLGAYAIRYQFGYIAYFLYFLLLVCMIIRGFRYRKDSPFAFVGASFAVFMFVISDLLCYITMRPFGFMMALVFLEISAKEDAEDC